MRSHWQIQVIVLPSLLRITPDAPECSDSSCPSSWHPSGPSAQEQEVSTFHSEPGDIYFLFFFLDWSRYWNPYADIVVGMGWLIALSSTSKGFFYCLFVFVFFCLFFFFKLNFRLFYNIDFTFLIKICEVILHLSMQFGTLLVTESMNVLNY